MLQFGAFHKLEVAHSNDLLRISLFSPSSYKQSSRLSFAPRHSFSSSYSSSWHFKALGGNRIKWRRRRGCETARMARFFRLSHRFFGCHFARSHFSALAAGQSHFQQSNIQTAYRLSHHTTQTHWQYFHKCSQLSAIRIDFGKFMHTNRGNFCLGSTAQFICSAKRSTFIFKWHWRRRRRKRLEFKMCRICTEFAMSAQIKQGVITLWVWNKCISYALSNSSEVLLNYRCFFQFQEDARLWRIFQ